MSTPGSVSVTTPIETKIIWCGTVLDAKLTMSVEVWSDQRLNDPDTNPVFFSMESYSVWIQGHIVIPVDRDIQEALDQITQKYMEAVIYEYDCYRKDCPLH